MTARAIPYAGPEASEWLDIATRRLDQQHAARTVIEDGCGTNAAAFGRVHEPYKGERFAQRRRGITMVQCWKPAR